MAVMVLFTFSVLAEVIIALSPSISFCNCNETDEGSIIIWSLSFTDHIILPEVSTCSLIFPSGDDTSKLFVFCALVSIEEATVTINKKKYFISIYFYCMRISFLICLNNYF